jgi:hypothetical protein
MFFLQFDLHVLLIWQINVFIITLFLPTVDNRDAKGRRRPDGTPEKNKSSLPGDGTSEETDSTRRVIANDEILALQIREEDLLKVLVQVETLPL